MRRKVLCYEKRDKDMFELARIKQFKSFLNLNLWISSLNTSFSDNNYKYGGLVLDQKRKMLVIEDRREWWRELTDGFSCLTIDSWNSFFLAFHESSGSSLIISLMYTIYLIIFFLIIGYRMKRVSFKSFGNF